MKNKRIIFTLIANLFLVFVGVGLVLPVMPEIKEVMSLSGATMGYLVAIFSLAQFLISPIVGRISDQIGRKPLIILGMILYGVSEFIFGFGTTISLLYISRILGGVSAAMIMPSIMSFAADVSTIEERPKVMGWVSGAISGGFVVGPGIGGLLGSISMRLPFFAAGSLGIIGCIFAFLFLKEEKKKRITHEVKPKTSIREIILKKEYAIPFLVILIASFGLAAFESVYSFFVNLTLNYSVQDIAIVITVSGLFALIVQVFYFDKLVRFLGEVKIIRISFFLSAIFVWVMITTANHWLTVLATFVIFLCFDLLRPAITTYISKEAGENQGIMNGMNSSLTSVGNILGPILAGNLLDINYRYPYLFVFFILLLTYGFTWLWSRTIRVKSYE